MLIKNNKGTILVVAVVCMSIMIIIGFVCLKIYSSQSILDTRDVVKQRLYYNAIGGIEVMKGYLAAKVAEDIRSHENREYADYWGDTGNTGNSDNNGHRGIVSKLVNNSGNNYQPLSATLLRDNTMYPHINVTVKVTCINSAPTGRFYVDSALRNYPSTIGGVSAFGGLTSDVTCRSYCIESEAKINGSFTSALSTGGTIKSVIMQFYFYTQKTETSVTGVHGEAHTFVRHHIHSVGLRRKLN
jgi:hypothetical protein